MGKTFKDNPYDNDYKTKKIKLKRRKDKKKKLKTKLTLDDFYKYGLT